MDSDDRCNNIEVISHHPWDGHLFHNLHYTINVRNSRVPIFYLSYTLSTTFLTSPFSKPINILEIPRTLMTLDCAPFFRQIHPSPLHSDPRDSHNVEESHCSLSTLRSPKEERFAPKNALTNKGERRRGSSRSGPCLRGFSLKDLRKVSRSEKIKRPLRLRAAVRKR